MRKKKITPPKNTKRAFIVSGLISYGMNLIEDSEKDYDLKTLDNRTKRALTVFGEIFGTGEYIKNKEIVDYIWNLSNDVNGITLNYDEMPYFIMMAGSLLPTKDYKDFLKLPSYITEVKLSKLKQKMVGDSVLKANGVLMEKLNVKTPLSDFVAKKITVKKVRDMSKKKVKPKISPNKNINKFKKNQKKKEEARKKILRTKIRRIKRITTLKKSLLLLAENHNDYSIETLDA